MAHPSVLQSLLDVPCAGLEPQEPYCLRTHVVPLIEAWVSNRGPGLVTTGGAPLYQCVCESANFVVLSPTDA